MKEYVNGHIKDLSTSKMQNVKRIVNKQVHINGQFVVNLIIES